jgi:hypothetical protein
MSYDFQNIYAALGPSGIQPFLTTADNILTYKLVTGVDTFDPARGAGPGRAYDASIFHIYTTDQVQVCSGEVLGTGPLPQKAIVGEYRISGSVLDYGRITLPGFQESWRSCSGEGRHEFSQQFTNFLTQNHYMATGVIGAVWTSVSGELLGVGGRVYAITATGAPYISFQRAYDYPRTA